LEKTTGIGVIDSRPELVIALVGAVGVRLDDLSNALKAALADFHYRAVDIRLSHLLSNWTCFTKQTGSGEHGRIRHFQQMGDAFRESVGKGDALARAAIAEIRAKRAEISGSPETPVPARAFILRQLKHPEEVELLRRVYGTSFLLIAGHAPRDTRKGELMRDMANTESRTGHEREYEPKASEVMNFDEKEDNELGQNTRDTYPKADFFINLGVHGTEAEVQRFIELFFGHPFHTPTPDEYAMYQASAVSLRSSDKDRQVGAVIADLDNTSHSKRADVIAVGMNEVPKCGGGFYWEGDSPDCRDQNLDRRGEDRASAFKIAALTELIEKIAKRKWLLETEEAKGPITLARELLPSLKRTQFWDIGEFSRPVHAEMASIIAAARRGVAIAGHSMFVTTFPCHNCAKHIIAAGIKKVVYLEPYPKSLASNLYREEIILEAGDEQGTSKVVFTPFAGIAPRQYEQLFSMSERGAKKGIPLKDWQDRKASLSPPYVNQFAARSYLAAEFLELEALPPEIYPWKKVTEGVDC
jgi:cytidine deaminase